LDAWRVKLLNILVPEYELIPVRTDSLPPKFVTQAEYEEMRGNGLDIERECVFAHASAPAVFGKESEAGAREDDKQNMSVRSTQGLTFRTMALSCSEMDAAVSRVHGQRIVALSRSKGQLYVVCPGGLLDPLAIELMTEWRCHSAAAIRGVESMPIKKPEIALPTWKLSGEERAMDKYLREKVAFSDTVTDLDGRPDEYEKMLVKPDSAPQVIKLGNGGDVNPLDAVEAFWRTRFHFCAIDAYLEVIPDRDEFRAAVFQLLASAWDSDLRVGRTKRLRPKTASVTVVGSSLRVDDPELPADYHPAPSGGTDHEQRRDWRIPGIARWFGCQGKKKPRTLKKREGRYLIPFADVALVAELCGISVLVVNTKGHFVDCSIGARQPTSVLRVFTLDGEHLTVRTDLSLSVVVSSGTYRGLVTDSLEVVQAGKYRTCFLSELPLFRKGYLLGVPSRSQLRSEPVLRAEPGNQGIKVRLPDLPTPPKTPPPSFNEQAKTRLGAFHDKLTAARRVFREQQRESLVILDSCAGTFLDADRPVDPDPSRDNPGGVRYARTYAEWKKNRLVDEYCGMVLDDIADDHSLDPRRENTTLDRQFILAERPLIPGCDDIDLVNTQTRLAHLKDVGQDLDGMLDQMLDDLDRESDWSDCSTVRNLDVGYWPTLVPVPPSPYGHWHTLRANEHEPILGGYMAKPDIKVEPVITDKIRFGTDAFRLADFIDPSAAFISGPRLNEAMPVLGTRVDTNVRVQFEGFLGLSKTKSGRLKIAPDKQTMSITPGFGNWFDNTVAESLVCTDRLGRQGRPRITQEGNNFADLCAYEFFYSSLMPEYVRNQEEVNALVHRANMQGFQRNYHGRADREESEGSANRLVFSIKPQFKPLKSDKLRLDKGGQGLLQSPASVNLEYMGFIRATNLMFKQMLGKGVMFETLQPIAEFRKELTQQLRTLPESARVAIADGETWDAQQNPMTLRAERTLHRLIRGVSDEMDQFFSIIEQYYEVRKDLPYIMFGILSGSSGGAKGSGFLDTLFGNTILQFMLSSRIIRGFGDAVSVGKGDDYLKAQSGLYVDTGQRVAVKKLLGMSISVDIADGGEFCGEVVSRAGMFPSITRTALKACASKAKDYKQFTEHQISWRDKVREWKECGLDETIGHTSQAERIAPEYVELCAAFVESMGHINEAQWRSVTTCRSQQQFSTPGASGYLYPVC
jgi:hypothetical protein